MQLSSIRAGALLAILAVTGGLWAYQANFSADPTDPLYPRTANSQGCSVAGSPTCIDPPGQWDMFSYSPTVPPTAHPSGISADLAWRVTIGRPDVEAVVFDTGVNYDHVDLRNQIWLNRGELPAPNGACPARNPLDTHDCDGDGIFNIEDYTGDSRISDTILPGVFSRSDLRVFEDGIDGDGNGYVDDISGFDFDDADGDEYDHRDFGHGTGRNGVIAAEPNNLAGIAGLCANCRISNARIEDTYVVVRAETTANAVIWAADHGFELVNMSVGHVGASSMSRKAIEYAYGRNLLPFSAIANEFHHHHGFVGLYDEVFAVGALSYAGRTSAGIAPANGQPTQAPATYLRKANYSNYGAHLNVVAPSDNLTTSHNGGFGDSGGTSSATPHVVGVAALVYSQARNVLNFSALAAAGGLADISNQEVRQVINQTADDIKPSDDPAPGTYPVSVGWDKWTGYGRVNAKKAVDLVTSGKIPPEADINSPDWYSYVGGGAGVVPVKFYANNRWRGNYNWVLEVAANVEPTTFTQIGAGSGTANRALASTSQVDNFTVNWDTAALPDDGYTLRLRVTDAADASIIGEDRMFVWLRRGLVDAGNHPGFPIRVTRSFDGDLIPVSVESMSNALVDLDGDNRLEIVIATADGEVRVFRDDGTPFASFGANGVVMTAPLPGLPGAASPAFDGNLQNGEVPVTGASIIGGVAVGDIDRDGLQEICAGAVNGKLYCWNADGSAQPGFPVSVDLPKRFDQYTRALTAQDLPQGEALVAPPTLGNMDGDAAGTLEIAAVSRDQKLYVWKADGSRLAGFPVAVASVARSSNPIDDDADLIDDKTPFGSISGVLIADIDGDGENDILVGTNEVSGSVPNTSGRIYAFSNAGVAKTGWPVMPTSAAADGVPIVAQGVVNGPLAANFDGDAQLEVVGHAFLGDATVYNHDGSRVRAMSGTHNAAGTPPDLLEDTPTGGPGRPDDMPVHTYVGLGAIADFNASQPGLEYLVGTVGNNLVVDVAAGSGQVTNFDHYFSAWNAGSGNHLSNFPRIVDGWQFIAGPVVADLDNSGGPEAIVTSSGLFVHAFNNSSGANIAGWPKFTGHWEVNTPSVGDLDNDGDVEVVTTTRLGYIQAWDSAGNRCTGTAINAAWRKYRHDEWNTGAFGTDTLRPARVLDLAGSRVGAAVNLAWTAVGDDGACGTAASYELAISDVPLTSTAAFDNPALARSSVPTAATGTPMSFSRTDTAARYYTLRVADEVNNRSILSPSVLVPAAAAVSGTGVLTVTQAGSPTADRGATVTVGSFTLTHSTTASEAHQLSQITLTLSDPSVFASLTLTGPGGRTASVNAPGSSATFSFNPALEIAPGSSAAFTLTSQLAASKSAALGLSWFNSAHADSGTLNASGTSALPATSLAALLLLGALLLLPRRLAVTALLGLGLLAGCNNDGAGPAPPPVPQTRASSVVISTIGAVTSSGGTVVYSGVPATLGTVTLRL